MKDTVEGWCPEVICSDCGAKGISVWTRGPLVPKGKSGSFCPSCRAAREARFRAGQKPLPIGAAEKSPGKPARP